MGADERVDDLEVDGRADRRPLWRQPCMQIREAQRRRRGRGEIREKAAERGLDADAWMEKEGSAREARDACTVCRWIATTESAALFLCMYFRGGIGNPLTHFSSVVLTCK